MLHQYWRRDPGIGAKANMEYFFIDWQIPYYSPVTLADSGLSN